MHPIVRLLPLFAVFPVAMSFAGDLTVRIERVRSDRGSIPGALYASEASYLNQPRARATFKVQARGGDIEYVFRNLAPGQYALSVFHDENDNGVLDRNPFGIPREGYGFSNHAQGTRGPPVFGRAAFAFDGTLKTITITLRY